MMFKGEKGILLQDQRLSAVILPDRGGKIASLRDLCRNRELLWQYEGEVYPALISNAPFSEADSSGFDDMFPSILPGPYGAEPWPDLYIPDHGEAWQLPWNIISNTTSTVSLELKGALFPYIIRKRISLTTESDNRPALKINYVLKNIGLSDFEWMWAAHPLFSVGPGTRFKLFLANGFQPVDLRLLNAYPSDILPEYGVEYPFPEGVGKLSIDRLPQDNYTMAIKYWFINPSCIVGAEIEDMSSDYTFYLAWDASVLPYLGIFINNGAWAGQRNMALEPASVPMDSIFQAKKAGFYPPRLAPGALKKWFFNIVLPE